MILDGGKQIFCELAAGIWELAMFEDKGRIFGNYLLSLPLFFLVATFCLAQLPLVPGKLKITTFQSTLSLFTS